MAPLIEIPLVFKSLAELMSAQISKLIRCIDVVFMVFCVSLRCYSRAAKGIIITAKPPLKNGDVFIFFSPFPL